MRITYGGNLPLKGDYVSLLFHLLNIEKKESYKDLIVEISGTFIRNLSEVEIVNYGITAVENHLNNKIPAEGYRDSSKKVIYISTEWHPELPEDQIKKNSSGKFCKEVEIQKPSIGFKLD